MRPNSRSDVDWPSLAPAITVWLLIVCFAAGFSWLSIARHLAYQSHAFDLGNMTQAVWNTAHGRLFRFTDMAVGDQVLTSRLAIHVEPLLVPLSLLYWIHSGPETLLVTQATVVSIGAWPLYLLARDWIGRPWLAAVFPFAYLAHPSLQNAVLDDFHAVTLSASFLAWAMYLLNRDKVIPFAIAAVLAAGTKEEVGLLVALLGVWLWLRGHRVAAIGTVVGGIAWFFISVTLIIPHFNPGGHSPYVSRYAYLGRGLSGIVRGIVTDPGKVAHVLSSPARQPYLLYLIHPLGLVPLLGAPVLLLALPTVVINLLSSDSRMYSGFYQYSAEIVPYVVVASAAGLSWITRSAYRFRIWRPAWLQNTVALLVLIAAAYDMWQWGFTPLSRGFVAPAPGAHQAVEDRLLRMIPPNAVVAAADEVEPHAADRRWVYVLPTLYPSNGPRAGYIVLDASIPSSPVEPRTLHTLAGAALRNGYRVAAAEDGVLLLRFHGRKHRFGNTFLDFTTQPAKNMTQLRIRWGPLQLLGFVVHPHSGGLNRARPAVSVETYWRLHGPVRKPVRIAILASPAYQGRSPTAASGWLRTSDSPTLDWLPVRAWRQDTEYHVAFVPLVPTSTQLGHVDVVLQVQGLGTPQGQLNGRREFPVAQGVRLRTIDVSP